MYLLTVVGDVCKSSANDLYERGEPTLYLSISNKFFITLIAGNLPKICHNSK